VTGRRRDLDPSEGIDSQRLSLALVLALAMAITVWWVVTRL